MYNRMLPAIPTTSDRHGLAGLGNSEYFVSKPIEGCSSRGVQLWKHDDLANTEIEECIFQPFIKKLLCALFFPLFPIVPALADFLKPAQSLAL